MSDITNLFRATVKALKTRQRAQGEHVPTDKSLLTTKPRGEFHTQTKKVIADIRQLKEFLLEHRKDYINVSSCIGSERSLMSDADRDQIDSDAQTFMRLASEAIKQLCTQAFSNRVSPTVKEHREAVIELTNKYLKGVCSIFSEQRAIRVKRVVDRKRLSRLESDNKRATKVVLGSDVGGSDDTGGSKEADTTAASPSSSPPAHDDTIEDELSLEEIQMFQLENQQMFDEMNSLVDEVKMIEGKVVEISRLQEIFADKVLEQEKDIERVADVVVGTTENIKEANEDIREAMKNNAGLRVWILFFLIVCSLSLLFLDWYNV